MKGKMAMGSVEALPVQYTWSFSRLYTSGLMQKCNNENSQGSNRQKRFCIAFSTPPDPCAHLHELYVAVTRLPKLLGGLLAVLDQEVSFACIASCSLCHMGLI